MRARAICVARKFSRSIWVRVKPEFRPEKSAKRIMAAMAAEHIASTRVNPARAFCRSTCPEQTTINVRCNQQASGLLPSPYSKRYTIIWRYLYNKQLENGAGGHSALRPVCEHRPIPRQRQTLGFQIAGGVRDTLVKFVSRR